VKEPRDYMPSQWETERVRPAGPAVQKSRAEIALDIRAFLKGRMAQQNRNRTNAQ
jgi:hypothetical protein